MATPKNVAALATQAVPLAVALLVLAPGLQGAAIGKEHHQHLQKNHQHHHHHREVDAAADINAINHEKSECEPRCWRYPFGNVTVSNLSRVPHDRPYAFLRRGDNSSLEPLCLCNHTQTYVEEDGLRCPYRVTFLTIRYGAETRLQYRHRHCYSTAHGCEDRKDTTAQHPVLTNKDESARVLVTGTICVAVK